MVSLTQRRKALLLQMAAWMKGEEKFLLKFENACSIL